MANFYTDNEDIKFHLGHPLMKKIVTLKERNFTEAQQYDNAPRDYEDAFDNYDKVLEILGGQILIVQFGGAVFRTEPLDLTTWITIIGSTSIVLWVGELIRLVQRLTQK